MLSDEQKENRRLIMQGRSRDSKGRLLPATTAQEAKIAELEAQITRLQVSNDHNAAEFARAIEEKRLAEQGRDAAIESRNRFQADLVAANNHVRSLEAHLAKVGQEHKRLYADLKEASDQLQQATYDIGCLKANAESLAPLLPRWAFIAFSGIVLFLVAYFAHRAGFTAAMEAAK